MLCSGNNLLLWSGFSLYNFVEIWPTKWDPASSIFEISRPALVPDKDPLKIHYEIHDIVPADL